MEPVAGCSSTPPVRPRFMKRTLHQIADLDIKRSTGAISFAEYKRLTTLYELSSIAFSADQTSLPPFDTNTEPHSFFDIVHDEIISMEVDRRSKYLVTISKFKCVSLYNISDNVRIFKPIMRMDIPYERNYFEGAPHSTHWFYDCNVFTVGLLDCIQFWDSRYLRIIDTIPLYSSSSNHVIAAKTCINNKHVAITGLDGNVFFVDMLRGTVVLTIPSIEKSLVRAICWNPNYELQYVTGNKNGNIYLWDVRFHKNYVRKFNTNSFSKLNSHSNPVIGLRFYNNGNSVVSVDSRGNIQTWDVNTGENYGNYYEPVLLSDSIKRNTSRCYQFDVTVNLKQDIIFLPTKTGLRIFDINTGEHLPNSNDVCLPLNCATYDPNRFRVYGGSNDLVKLWTPDQKNRV